jgi:hypothetical protein
MYMIVVDVVKLTGKIFSNFQELEYKNFKEIINEQECEIEKEKNRFNDYKKTIENNEVAINLINDKLADKVS